MVGLLFELQKNNNNAPRSCRRVQLFLAMLMMITGSINTIVTKFADQQCAPGPGCSNLSQHRGLAGSRRRAANVFVQFV